MLEPPLRRGRRTGTATPQIDDNFPFILMYHIALRTGERGAERLARLVVATRLLPKRAADSSVAHRLAKCWRHRVDPRVRKELDELTAKVTAKVGCVEDPETVVRELKHDPYWREWSNGSYGVNPEK